VAAFSLRSFGEGRSDESKAAQIERVASEIGQAGCPIATAQQVHGAKVEVVSEAGEYAQADGLVTDRANLLLSVVVADCLPVYFWSLDGHCIGLIHAGWRGSAAGIAMTAIRVTREAFGVEAKELYALLGPCICQDCYEVGPEVAHAFTTAELRPGRSDRYHLDLRAANRRQLIQAGVPGESIISDDLCSRCRPDLLYSYRATGQDTGRMVAMIGLIGL